MNKGGAHMLVVGDEIEIVCASFQYPEQFLRKIQNLQKAFLLAGVYTAVAGGGNM